MKTCLSIFAACMMFAAGPGAAAYAQDNSAEIFSDEEMAKIGAMLTGSWRTAAPVTAADADQPQHAVLSIAPVAIAEMPDAFYVEAALASDLSAPVRQSVWQLIRGGGKVWLRTMEFRRAGGRFAPAVGLWAAPEAFPPITGEDLITTMHIELKASGSAYTGATPHAYPTSIGGAVAMTTEITFDGTTFTTADRGLDASGGQVWGVKPGEKTSFSRTDTGVKTVRHGDGLISITYPGVKADSKPVDGSTVRAHYAGYLGNGWSFDASYERGSPLSYAYGRQMIEGWTKAMADVVPGMRRRLVIPSAMAYKEGGLPRARIPGNSTLYFDVTVVEIVPPAETPAAPGAMEVRPAPTGAEMPKPVKAVPVPEPTQPK